MSEAKNALRDLEESILQSRTLADFTAVKRTVEMIRQLPEQSASARFSEWINQGSSLAAAAGCHVGIKVTEAKP